jgi:hypothetical protein
MASRDAKCRQGDHGWVFRAGMAGTRRRRLIFFFTEPRNIYERFRTRQHRQQTEEQNLIERVNHSATLATVRHILEMTQENN